MVPDCASQFDGWAAIGTHLQMWDNSVSPAVWVPIVKLDDITGPQGKTDTIETTTHDSTDGFKHFKGSLKDSGEVQVSGIWDPTDPTHGQLLYKGLKKAWIDSKTRTWRIVYPTSPLMADVFCGFVNGYSGPKAPVKDVLRFNVTIKVEGAADLGLASASDS